MGHEGPHCGTKMYHGSSTNYWKSQVVKMSFLSSLAASKVVIMTTYGAVSDDTGGNLKVFCFSHSANLVASVVTENKSKIIDNQRNFEWYIFHFVVSSVSADGIALLFVTTSAVTVVTKFVIYTGPALEKLRCFTNKSKRYIVLNVIITLEQVMIFKS